MSSSTSTTTVLLIRPSQKRAMKLADLERKLERKLAELARPKDDAHEQIRVTREVVAVKTEVSRWSDVGLYRCALIPNRFFTRGRR